jgi:hypothetical protein
MILNGGLSAATSMTLISAGNSPTTSSSSSSSTSGFQFESSSSTAQQVRLVQLVLDASKVRKAAAVATTPNSPLSGTSSFVLISLLFF